MRALRVALLVASLVATRAIAAEAPRGFRDIPWGASEEQARQNHALRACHWGEDGERVCELLNIDIGDRPVTALVVFFGPLGRQVFSAVHLSFRLQYYQEIRQGLIDRFGEPTTRRVATLQTSAGGTVERESLSWDFSTSSIVLSQDGGELQRSAATIATREYGDFLAKRAAERREKARRGF